MLNVDTSPSPPMSDITLSPNMFGLRLAIGAQNVMIGSEPDMLLTVT